MERTVLSARSPETVMDLLADVTSVISGNLLQKYILANVSQTRRHFYRMPTARLSDSASYIMNKSEHVQVRVPVQ